MQGDIKLPGQKKRRSAAKSKPIEHYFEPQPDVVIDEANLSLPKKKRKVIMAPRKHFIKFWRWWLGLSKNERFAVIAVALLIFGVGAIGWFAFIRPSSSPSIDITRRVQPKPKVPITVASPLSGLQVDPKLASRPVTGIMIENSIYARPQSGLQAAGVVYEAIAEGGITRFLALFQETTPQYVGPVRSLRPYYIDFAAPFEASIVHAGGSSDALRRVRNGNYRDLDQFFNSGAFWRVSSRPAPHNLYTSFAKLDALNKAKKYKSSHFTIWPRKPEKKLAVAKAKTIDISISSHDYNSHYDYDPKTNSYARSEGGEAHKDIVKADGKKVVRLNPQVVIVLVMTYGIASDGQHSVYDTTGEGRAYIFQDGGITKGKWVKRDIGSQIQFKDSTGALIKLNAGQTWITLVSDTGKVRYAP